MGSRSEGGHQALELALAIADELEDGTTGYLIERALDEARARLFIPFDERTIDR
jgi:hypothetical protein